MHRLFSISSIIFVNHTFILQGGPSVKVMETDHIRKKKLADPSAEFVLKLEPAWSMEEDSPDQPSAVYNTVQPMSDNTSLLSLDSKHLCYMCPAAFVLVSSLELHLALVHGEKLHMVLPESSTPDRCDAGNCSNTDKNKEVDSHGNRKTMKRKVHKSAADEKHRKKERQHVCDICRKSFCRPSLLKTHKLIHSNVRPFVCDVCGKSFTQVAHLTDHKRIHTGERPYKCPQCDSGFKQSSTLHNHIKSVHDGTRPHLCDVCGAAFFNKAHFTDHKRIHTGEKPLACSDCGKDFIQASALAKHRLTHTGEKKLLCSDSGKSFARSSSLAHHLTKTKEKTHVCPDCGKGFTYPSGLARHCLSHTRQKQGLSHHPMC